MNRDTRQALPVTICIVAAIALSGCSTSRVDSAAMAPTEPASTNPNVTGREETGSITELTPSSALATTDSTPVAALSGPSASRSDSVAMTPTEPELTSPNITDPDEPKSVAELVPGPGLSASDSAPVVAEDAQSTLPQMLANPDNAFPALTATVYRAFAPGSRGTHLTSEFFVNTISVNENGEYVISYVLDGTSNTVIIGDANRIDNNSYRAEVDGTSLYFWSWTVSRNDLRGGFFHYMDSLLLSPDMGDANPRMWFVFGVRAENLPATGSATYLGRFRANAYKTADPDRGKRLFLRGAMRIVANFDMSGLEGRIDAIRNWDNSGVPSDWPTSSLEISDGRIKDGQFTATLVGQDSDPNAPFDKSLRGFEGSILGEFYGPDADELGGVVAAERDESGNVHDRLLYGFIGGKNVEAHAAVAVESGLHPLSGRVFGSGKDALIVMAHGDVSRGGPSDYMYKYAERISARYQNVTVAAVLRPGYFDAQGRVSPGSNHARRGDQYTAENNRYLATTVENLKSRVQPEKVIVVGHSGGAWQFAAIFGQFQNLVDGAVLVGCPCDVDLWVTQHGFRPPTNSPWPSDFVDTVDESLKVVALTGSNDTVTPPNTAYEYIQTLRDLGVDTEFAYIDGVGHDYDGTVHAAVVSAIDRILTDAPDGDPGYQSVAMDLDVSDSVVRSTTATEVTAVESDKGGGFRVSYIVDGQEQSIDLEARDYGSFAGFPTSYHERTSDRSYYLYNPGSFTRVPRFDHFDVKGWQVVDWEAGSATDTTSVKLGYVTVGIPTPDTDLPSGTATYVGRVFGRTRPADNTARGAGDNIVGRLTLDADFSQSTISGNIDQVEDAARGQAYVSSSGQVTIENGVIDSSRFTAELTGVQAYADFEGDMAGQFFGPAAEEVGGVMSGTFSTRDEVMVGYFGAEQP